LSYCEVFGVAECWLSVDVGVVVGVDFGCFVGYVVDF